MLAKYLHELKDTGEVGFEGLLRRLLTEISGFEFRLSRTGSQYGRDARAQGSGIGSVMFECKNYRKTELNERELIAELDQAIGDDPLLDVWILAASRLIPDQLSTQLSKKAARHNVDFLGLDCGTDEPGSLDCLCAAYPTLVLKALSNLRLAPKTVAECKQVMSDIAGTAGFRKRVAYIEKRIREPTLSWPSWLSDSSKKWLSFMADEQISRARFGQPIHILSPSAHTIVRKGATSVLDKWWQGWIKETNLFFMLGDEGDGKTWSVAQWLTKQIQMSKTQLPPVVFISSIDASGGGSLEKLVLSRLEKDFGHRNWKERLDRWRTSTHSRDEGPLAIVVLDGLNERQSPSFWRNVVDTGLSEEWKNSVAIICTARTGYWNEFFKPLLYLKATTHIIQPYDDQELKDALSMRAQKLDDYSLGLHSLLKKPRYLDLAVKHRDQLTARGDFTITRLIYEDWKDRYQRKNSCPMSEDQFNELLTTLGKDFLNGQEYWNPGEIAATLALAEDRVLAFQELSTGGIIHKSGDGWQVQAGPLALGLGMLLCAQLQAAERDNKSLQETIASWIEPYSGVELQSQVLELAALHSLMKDHSSSLRIELLAAWLSTQNPSTVLERPVIRRFTAYLPENCDTYFDLAEKVWSSGCDNPWAQEILLRGFIDWAHDSEHFLKMLPARLERWLAMVPVNGLPLFRRSDNAAERCEKARQQLILLFGQEAVESLGTVDYEGYRFVLIGDDGWLRLARVALAIISTFGDRTPFLKLLVTSMLSDSLFAGEFNYPDRMSLVKWLLRSSTTDIADELLALAIPLSSRASLVCQRAAARLFTSIGSESGWMRWQALDQEVLFPTPEWVREAQQNPLESFFSVQTEDLEAYPEKADFEVWNFLRHCQDRITQRKFAPRGNISSRLLPVFDRFEGTALWVDGAQSSNEHILNQFQPILARYCSSQLCELLRSNFMQATKRAVPSHVDGFFQKIKRFIEKLVFRRHIKPTEDQLKSLFNLRFEINEHELLFGQAELESLSSAWRFNRSALINSDGDHQYAESLLFQTLLPMWNAQQQLSELLTRDHRAFELASCVRSFKEGDCLEFSTPTCTDDWIRLALFLGATHRPLLRREDVDACLDSSDDDLRTAMLRYLSGSQDIDTIKWCLTSKWCWRPTMTFVEQEHGAFLLIEYGKDIPIAELIERVPPTRRGTALLSRDFDSHHMQDYAEWIDKTLTRTLDFELPDDFPSIEIEFYSSLPSSPYPVSVVHDDSQSIHFVNPEAVWGGPSPKKIPNFEQNLEKINKEWKERSRILKEVSEQGSARGHHWIGNIFHTDGLKEAILIAPEIADSWMTKISDTQNLYRARSFFQALCETLFDLPERHQDASNLYQALKKEARLTHVVIPNIGLPYLDSVLLRSEHTVETERLWLEKLNACTCDRDLLELAILIRYSPKSQALTWFKTRLKDDCDGTIPFYKARAFALLGFLDETAQEPWLLKELDGDTYWLKKVQKTAQKRVSNEADCRFWFNKFCNSQDLDESWCAFRLFLACVNRCCWLWIDCDMEQASLPQEKLRFFELNRGAIKSACKENEKKLKESFLDCKVDVNLRPWLRFLGE